MLNWLSNTGTNVLGFSWNCNTEKTTGSQDGDKINGIFDLYGCHQEWTLACGGDNSNFNGRTVFGVKRNYEFRPACATGIDPYTCEDVDGTRFSLYIN